MTLHILNGPNLNLLGSRQPDIYGADSFDGFLGELRQAYPELDIHYTQSNHEGDLIDALHAADKRADAVILNAGALTHTSLALGDAVAAIQVPVIEVHISNIFSREAIRHQSYTAGHCQGMLTGFGLNTYLLAVEACVLQVRPA